MPTLSPKERLTRQVRGQEIDRVPMIGGWIGGARQLAQLAGVSVQEYLANPAKVALQAYQKLGVDGMIGPVLHTTVDQVRTGHFLEEDRQGIEPEALVEHANAIPDSEREILKGFDAAAVEREYRGHFEGARREWPGGIQQIGNYWDVAGHFALYTQFGYDAFLSACALYPQAVGKIWWARNLIGREKAKVLARLYRELDLVPMFFCGEDLCNNQGVMISPQFLRQHYHPHIKMALQPLLDAGIRIIHHCDGDVRPVLDDFVACGYSGFQGFQFEVGIDPYQVRQKRTLRGEVPLFWASMSVTYTLPFGTPGDVRDEVDWFYDWTEGGQGMFLFTSNVTGVEVPAGNIQAGYEHGRTLRYNASHRAPKRAWPGGKIKQAPAAARE